MKIPLHKLHEIRRLLYTDRPSYARGMLSPATGERAKMINNDEVLARLVNEILDILAPNVDAIMNLREELLKGFIG